MIKIICIGKIKKDYNKKAISDYKKRITKYSKIEIIELKERNEGTVEKNLEKEKEDILKRINENDYVIALDLKGKKVTSEEFSEVITKFNLTSQKNLVFIIGSSEGINGEIKAKADKLISFSNLTFPHQLFRTILLEQIYRAYKIINNEEYHK